MKTDETKLDEQSLDFLNDLRKFDKDKLVDLIHEFWVELKKEAETIKLVIWWKNLVVLK